MKYISESEVLIIEIVNIWTPYKFFELFEKYQFAYWPVVNHFVRSVRGSASYKVVYHNVSEDYDIPYFAYDICSLDFKSSHLEFRHILRVDYFNLCVTGNKPEAYEC